MDSVSYPLQKPSSLKCVSGAGQPKANKTARLSFGSRAFRKIPSRLSTQQMIDSLAKAEISLRDKVICSSNTAELSHHLQTIFSVEAGCEQTSDISALQVVEALNNLRLADAYHRYVDQGEEGFAPVLRESMNRAASLPNRRAGY
ncbi:hypothetical protein [Endozoicomonas numazuensis]|nr:hypothetical protein [Endozoicomonas numazuensis]